MRQMMDGLRILIGLPLVWLGLAIVIIGTAVAGGPDKLFQEADARLDGR